HFNRFHYKKGGQGRVFILGRASLGLGALIAFVIAALFPSTAWADADLALVMSGPATLMQGQNATYSITLTNAGPDTATNVVVTDALPAALTFVSLSVPSGPGWITSTPAGPGGTVTMSIGSLASGATATFTVVAGLNPGTPAGTTITNTA